MNIAELDLQKYEGELPQAKRIYCYEEDKIYESAREFAETHGVKSNIHIYRTCNHIETRTVKGMHIFWLYEYERMT